MEDIKIMKELIKITNNNGKSAVSARELHQFLVVDAKGGQKGEMFAHWIKRMIDYLDLEENIDYSVLEFNYQGLPIARISKSDNQRVAKRDYVLTIDSAKEISMVQNNDKGKEARNYFIACEKKLKEVHVIPQTYSEALLLASRQAEQIELQEAELRMQAPKVVYHDEVLQSNSLISTTTIAKELGLTAQNLNKKLQEDKVIFKQNGTFVLFSKYQDKGYSGTKTTTYTDSIGSKKSNILLYWTEEGRRFILNRYMA